VATHRLAPLPARRGHFRLESGYHTDTWLTLDALFASPSRVAPLVSALAARLEVHGPTAVCGPYAGGAFLAQAVATVLDVEFYYSERFVGDDLANTLFSAEYRLPAGLASEVKGRRVAVVDDAVSAGSSARATVAALEAADASIAAVGTFLLLGDAARTHFAAAGVPVEALEQRTLPLWQPEECPLCVSRVPLEDRR